MYTIIGLSILGVFYIIVNILSFTGSAGEVYIFTLSTINGTVGIVTFGTGIYLNNWFVFLGLILVLLAFKQYQAYVKSYTYYRR